MMRRRAFLRGVAAAAAVAVVAPLVPAPYATGGTIPAGLLVWWPSCGVTMPRGWSPMKVVATIPLSNDLIADAILRPRRFAGEAV